MIFLIKCNYRSFKTTSIFKMNTNNTSGVCFSFFLCSHTCIVGAQLIETLACVLKINEENENFWMVTNYCGSSLLSGGDIWVTVAKIQ